MGGVHQETIALSTALAVTRTTPEEFVAPGCTKQAHIEDCVEIDGAGSNRSLGTTPDAAVSRASNPHSQQTDKVFATNSAASTTSGHVSRPTSLEKGGQERKACS